MVIERAKIVDERLRYWRGTEYGSEVEVLAKCANISCQVDCCTHREVV